MAIVILTIPHIWIWLARQELGVTMTLKSGLEQQGQPILNIHFLIVTLMTGTLYQTPLSASSLNSFRILLLNYISLLIGIFYWFWIFVFIIIWYPSSLISLFYVMYSYILDILFFILLSFIFGVQFLCWNSVCLYFFSFTHCTFIYIYRFNIVI